MGLLKNDPEQKRQKDEERARKAQEKEAANVAAAEEAKRRAWLASPPGQARTAKEAGHTFFQIILSLSETQRSLNSVLSGVVETKTRASLNSHPHVLQQIEEEGWQLQHASWVFQETGSVSRDKFLSSGQTEQVTGQIIGIYLFRVTT